MRSGDDPFRDDGSMPEPKPSRAPHFVAALMMVGLHRPVGRRPG